MNLSDLPADVAAAVERGEVGPHAWVVDADGLCDFPAWHEGKTDHPYQLVPPAVFARLDQPCSTCGGEGVDWARPHVKRESPVAPGLMVWQPQDCPDCPDGRQVFTIVKPCPECDGVGTVDLSADDYLAAGISWADGADDRPGLEDCGECKGEGSVSVARATLRVLPWFNDPDDTPDPIALVEVWENGQAFYWPEGAVEDGDGIPLGVLDPLPSPGQWVVMLEVVS